MRARVDLSLQAADKAALRALTAEEREVVLDQLLIQVREDLEWVMERATAADEAPPAARLPRR